MYNLRYKVFKCLSMMYDRPNTNIKHDLLGPVLLFYYLSHKTGYFNFSNTQKIFYVINNSVASALGCTNLLCETFC